MREEAEDDRTNVGTLPEKAVEAVPLTVDNDDMHPILVVVVPALLDFCGRSV